jgi:hypothetical protein
MCWMNPMLARLSTLVATVVMTAGLAGAEEPAIVNPTWLERPTGEVVQEFYPPHAIEQRVVGEVTMGCIVRVDGRLDCRVDSETPPGWGFGEAALGISRFYAMRPAMRDGVPVEARYTLRMPFSMEGEEEADPGLPFLERPLWEAAPSLEKVEELRPQALPPGARARGVLACMVKPDRTLDCTVVRDTPVGRGVGAAALAVAQHFRIAASDSALAARYRSRRFVLPINFGFPRQSEPVGVYDGADPVTIYLEAEVVERIYPGAARKAGIEGRASVLCTLPAAGAPQCVIESERPERRGFGAAALSLLTDSPVEAWQWLRDYGELLEGDRVRVIAPFTLNRGGTP